MSRLPTWIGQHLAAIRALIVLTVITGAIYPLAMLGIGQAAFPNQANGSLVTVNGKVAGSSLICQEFTDANGNPLPRYFQPRPSTASSSTSPGPGTSKYGCDAFVSGGSQLTTTSETLLKNINADKAAYAKFNGVSPAQVPPDAVTTSGSGLDPYISPQNADLQVNRVAAARHLPAATVAGLVSKYTLGRPLGFLGEPRVNVLNLNIALDQLKG